MHVCIKGMDQNATKRERCSPIIFNSDRRSYISQHACSPGRKFRLRDTYKAASQAAEIDQCVAGWTCRGSDGTSTEKWQLVQEFRLNCIPSQTGQQLWAQTNYVTAETSPLQRRYIYIFFLFIFFWNPRMDPVKWVLKLTLWMLRRSVSNSTRSLCVCGNATSLCGTVEEFTAVL